MPPGYNEGVFLGAFATGVIYSKLPLAPVGFFLMDIGNSGVCFFKDKIKRKLGRGKK